jgi:hypothetical protein
MERYDHAISYEENVLSFINSYGLEIDCAMTYNKRPFIEGTYRANVKMPKEIATKLSREKAVVQYSGLHSLSNAEYKAVCISFNLITYLLKEWPHYQPRASRAK